MADTIYGLGRYQSKPDPKDWNLPMRVSRLLLKGLLMLDKSEIYCQCGTDNDPDYACSARTSLVITPNKVEDPRKLARIRIVNGDALFLDKEGVEGMIRSLEEWAKKL